MVDATRAQAALRYLEAASTAKDQVLLGYAHVLEADVHVTVRRIVVAVDLPLARSKL